MVRFAAAKRLGEPSRVLAGCAFFPVAVSALLETRASALQPWKATVVRVAVPECTRQGMQIARCTRVLGPIQELVENSHRYTLSLTERRSIVHWQRARCLI